MNAPTSRRSSPLALAVPLSRFTSRVGGGSAHLVRPTMPPTFLYLLALIVYVAVACAVWMVAIVLAFSRRRRALAKKIAAGMAGSFPGVFIFQLISVLTVSFVYIDCDSIKANILILIKTIYYL